MTSTAPNDDAEIPNSAPLWRRIFPGWWVADEKIGGKRLSSMAFENSKDGSGTSVVLATESTMEHVLLGHNGYGIAELTAGSARAVGQGVRRVPLDGVPGHAQIEGVKNNPTKRALAKACVIVRAPA